MDYKNLSEKELIDQLAETIKAMQPAYVPIEIIRDYGTILAEISKRLEQLNKIKILLDR